MKDISKIVFNLSSHWIKYKILLNKELWDIKLVLEDTWLTCLIIDYHYKKSYLCKDAS